MKDQENGGEKGRKGRGGGREKENERETRKEIGRKKTRVEKVALAKRQEKKGGNGRKGKRRRALDVVVVTLPRSRPILYFVFPEIPWIHATEFEVSRRWRA